MVRTVETDVLVIGAGPAGTCAAAFLRQSGIDVTILERSQFPRFVIGESLLPQCMDILDAAGLLSAVQQRGYQRKSEAAFFHGDLSEFFLFEAQFTEGWGHTFQVPRADFDKTLSDQVEAMGAQVLFEHEVTGIEPCEPRVTACGPDGDVEFRCRFVLDASGYGRVLPNMLGLATPSEQANRKSFFSHFPDPRRRSEDAERIWICIHPEDREVWYWVIPFSDGNASLGVVGPSERFNSQDSANEHLRQFLDCEPNIRRRFAPFEPKFPARSLEAYSAASTKLFGDRYALIGNSGLFFDPIFSSGVTVALKSAELASGALVRQLRGESVDWQRDYVDPLQVGTDTFEAFVNAWYDGTLQRIFFLQEKHASIKSMICSILAGYVWDVSNAYVKQPRRRLRALAAYSGADQEEDLRKELSR